MKRALSQRLIETLVFMLIVLLAVTVGCQETARSGETAALANAGDEADKAFKAFRDMEAEDIQNLNLQAEGDKIPAVQEAKEEPQAEGKALAPAVKKTEPQTVKKPKKTQKTLSEPEPKAKAEEPQPEPEPKPEPAPAPSGKCKALEDMMLGLINRERKDAGIQPLTMHKKLVELARLRSTEMADLGRLYTKHISPTYGSPFEMMKSYGITYTNAGENIAYNSSVERAHEKLMLSEGHRNNILNPQFNNVGIGIVERDGRCYITQMFIN